MFGNTFKEGRTDPEPLYSKSDSYYIVEKKGDRWQVNKMGTEGAIIAQPYQSEGVSHFIYTKRELTLLQVKASDGSIKPAGTVPLADLSYEFSDGAYVWNQDRDLKAREPLLTTGEVYEADQASLEGGLVGILDEMLANFDMHDLSADNVERLHKYGLNFALPLLISMDYAGLRSVFNRLKADVSEAGVTKRNLYTEFLGSIGTTAAAIFIRDAINEGLFDNGRDAARALTAIPFHIRRPNIQLVKEIESLMDTNTDKVVEMALPLTIGHLVRITCERAGKSPYSQEGKQCLTQFSDKYAKEYFDKFMASTSYEDKVLAINVLHNIKWGSVSELLRPVVYGEVKEIDDDIQSRAVTAAVFSTFASRNTADYYLPVFMNLRNGPETRIAALKVLSWGTVSLSHLSSIVTVLYAERNFEILNYAFTHFEKYATTINPCHEKKRELFGYFFKYMNQYGFHDREYGFGISKTFFQEFQQEKYGYGGSTEVHIVGSPRSTTPLHIAVDIFSTMYHGYASHLLGVHLRIEGLAKAIVRKFKKLPEAQWKLEDLAKLLAKMGVQTKPDLPIRVEVLIWLKGTVVINRVYGEADTEEGGKISDFLKDLQGATAGNENTINDQRALMMGLTLYEQPTEAGSPMFFLNDLTTMASFKATVKRGLSRGVIFRDVNYDLHLNSQGTNMMAFIVLATKTRYEIVQDRVYAAHFPRQFVVGINLMKKELRLQIKRPEFQDPLLLVMHSRTTVAAKKMDISGDANVAATCPTCSNSMVLSKGNTFKKSRNIIEDTNKDLGSTIKVGYFDCELDISRANTVNRLAQTFSPENKNPQTPLSIFSLGMRQARAFFLWFPKAEQCGAFFRFSQSEQNPVHEVDITVQGKVDSNESKFFMEGKKILLKVRIELKGEPVNRDYKFQLKYEYGPGALKNNVRAQFARQAAPSLGMPEYSVCFSANNQFPDFPDEFISANLDADLKVTGDVTIKYGEGSSCADVNGEVQINFEHQTTDLAHQELKDVDYYKKCMAEKNKPEWQSRQALPWTKHCFQTAYDAALARKYSWDVQLNNLTPYVRSWITKGLTVVNAAMVPYWQMDSEAITTALSANEKFHVDLEFKNREQSMDMVMTNSKGKSTYNDVIVRTPMRESLRALRFSSLVGKLIQGNVLSKYFFLKIFVEISLLVKCTSVLFLTFLICQVYQTCPTDSNGPTSYILCNSSDSNTILHIQSVVKKRLNNNLVRV